MFKSAHDKKYANTRPLQRQSVQPQAKEAAGLSVTPYGNQAQLLLGRSAAMPPVTAFRPSQTPMLQRKCAECEEEDKKQVQAKQDVTTARASSLVVGPADDPAEREADSIADAILSGSSHRPPTRLGVTSVQAKGVEGGACDSTGGDREEEEKDSPVQTKLDGAATGDTTALSARLRARKGKGDGLPSNIGKTFEQHLGVSLGGVRLHRDAEAGELAKSINVLAFTTGSDIYFAPGRYAPETSAGAHLLSHEMVHVAQQGATADNAPIRRYSLTGFTPPQEAQMRSAVSSAKTKMTGCAGKGIPDKDIANIVRGLDKANYVYNPELKICGYSDPITDTVELGPKSFIYEKCCDLDSTLAHECAHSFAWSFEDFARKVECTCFGCSC